ncbi:MAG: hypothetical protein ACLTK0_01505 [Anaerovoracaceae bacterium]
MKTWILSAHASELGNESSGHSRRTSRREDRYHHLSENPEELIASVLSPAKVEEVIVDESGENRRQS